MIDVITHPTWREQGRGGGCGRRRGHGDDYGEGYGDGKGYGRVPGHGQRSEENDD